MMHYDEVYIYFDTNTLECRHDNVLFLDKIALSNLYKEIVMWVNNSILKDKVHICIPEVVWKEILEHMERCYFSEKKSFNDKINCWKKTFGSFLKDMSNFFKIEKDEDYKEYLEKISQEFINKNKEIVSIIEYPRNKETFDNILDKAIRSESPFTKVKGKKDYSDAGFKDALIAETIIYNTKNLKGIFVTKDNDFKETFREYKNIKCCSEEKEVKEEILKNFNISEETFEIDLEFRNNSYLLERIISDAGCSEKEKYIFESIENIEDINESDEKRIILKIIINNKICLFEIEYNIGAKEINYSKYID